MSRSKRCDSLLGTKHDVIGEVFELADLIETGGDVNKRNQKMWRVVSWLREPNQELQRAVSKVGELWNQDPSHTPVFLLLVEVSHEITGAFNAMCCADRTVKDVCPTGVTSTPSAL